MREWNRRKKRNRQFVNKKSPRFSAEQVTIRKKRSRARKDAHERYLTARYQQELKSKGRVFIPEYDTKQVTLDETF